MTAARILILESDPAGAEQLRNLLSNWGYETVLGEAPNHSPETREQFQHSAIIAAVGSQDGFSQLHQINNQHPDTPVILLTDSGSIEMAVRAVKEEGAYHYFERPVDPDRLRIVIDRAVEFTEAKRENELLRRQLQDRG